MKSEEKQNPLKYFLSEIGAYSPLKVTCPECEVNTVFSRYTKIRTTERSIYLWTYQCQSCGKLECSEEGHIEGVRVGLDNSCDCGGQFRRDKNIFCPSCNYRKSDENKPEETLHASPEEMESIKKRHGNEEMQ